MSAVLRVPCARCIEEMSFSDNSLAVYTISELFEHVASKHVGSDVLWQCECATQFFSTHELAKHAERCGGRLKQTFAWSGLSRQRAPEMAGKMRACEAIVDASIRLLLGKSSRAVAPPPPPPRSFPLSPLTPLTPLAVEKRRADPPMITHMLKRSKGAMSSQLFHTAPATTSGPKDDERAPWIWTPRDMPLQVLRKQRNREEREQQQQGRKNGNEATAHPCVPSMLSEWSNPAPAAVRTAALPPVNSFFLSSKDTGMMEEVEGVLSDIVDVVVGREEWEKEPPRMRPPEMDHSVAGATADFQGVLGNGTTQERALQKTNTERIMNRRERKRFSVHAALTADRAPGLESGSIEDIVSLVHDMVDTVVEELKPPKKRNSRAERKAATALRMQASVPDSVSKATRGAVPVVGPYELAAPTLDKEGTADATLQKGKESAGQEKGAPPGVFGGSNGKTKAHVAFSFLSARPFTTAEAEQRASGVAVKVEPVDSADEATSSVSTVFGGAPRPTFTLFPPSQPANQNPSATPFAQCMERVEQDSVSTVFGASLCSIPIPKSLSTNQKTAKQQKKVTKGKWLGRELTEEEMKTNDDLLSEYAHAQRTRRKEEGGVTTNHADATGEQRPMFTFDQPQVRMLEENVPSSECKDVWYEKANLPWSTGPAGFSFKKAVSESVALSAATAGKFMFKPAADMSKVKVEVESGGEEETGRRAEKRSGEREGGGEKRARNGSGPWKGGDEWSG